MDEHEPEGYAKGIVGRGNSTDRGPAAGTHLPVWGTGNKFERLRY